MRTHARVWCYRFEANACACIGEEPQRTKRLCLYVVCQSYLPDACLEFMDLVRRLPDSACNAGCVSLSEEAQWLRGACARNRARLIARVCERMGLRVPTVLDYSASPSTPDRRMAFVCAESLHHDLQFASPQRVRVLNYCAETSSAFNGLVCAMAPWEGVWLFRGKSGDGQPDCRAGVMLPTAAPSPVVAPSEAVPLTRGTWPFHEYPPLRVFVSSSSTTTTLSSSTTAQRGFLQGLRLGTTTTPSRAASVEQEVALAYERAMGVNAWLAEEEREYHRYTEEVKGLSCAYLLFNETVLERMKRQGWRREQSAVCRLIPIGVGLFERMREAANEKSI